ncbi:hypothetical protein NE237_009481 [Protea cynaroides]|uniref:PGG domain-containing protein n=1 Tax=Protea cynaroides TaxID=273540 RepID=A0A9Q0KXX7_9MAGN|nr:hypothetical protein NE237_009481 [Protea cynaroides]
MHQSTSWESRDDTLQSFSSHLWGMEGQMETKVSSGIETAISMASEEKLQDTNPISLDDVPLLRRENYTTWKDMMEKFLKNQGLWGYVDGTIHEPENFSKDKVFELWKIFKIKCEVTVMRYIAWLDIRYIWNQLDTMYEFSHPTNIGVKMKSTRYTWCLPFYEAIVDGDWKTIVEFLSKNKGALTAVITSRGEVPLHLALNKRQVNLALELIKIMSAEDLSKQFLNSRTALHIAASDGNMEIVKAIVEKDNKLVTIQNFVMCTPIMDAASAREKKVVNYLYPIAKSQETNRKEGERERPIVNLLTCLIWCDFYELALDLLREYPSFVLFEDANGVTPIFALSKRPSAFRSSFASNRNGSGKLGYYWQKFMYSLLDIHVDAKIACWHIREDTENTIHTSGDSTRGNITCGLCTSTNCIIFQFWKGLWLCFRKLCQNALKLVPGCKNIYEEKLKHYQAHELLKEMWRILPDFDHVPAQHEEYEFVQTSQQHGVDGHEKNKVHGVEYKVVRVTQVAIKNGIVEFVEEIINYWPQLLSMQLVFHWAITNRQEKIFRLIHHLGPLKFTTARIFDEDKNSLSHLAAIKASTQILNQVPGVVLQLQRELLWYKEVESIMPVWHASFENKNGETPRLLFTEQHKDLVKEGATWMKDTSTQCMVVATLITTIMFAAMFTVPGVGNEETDHGYIHGKFPIIFVISNILALCSSVASILMFLAIITSRYAEEDFFSSLPQMLMKGLFFLFISIVGMMIAFVAALFVMLPSQVLWVSCPIIFMASIPIVLYALVELPLFFQLMFTTSSSSVFGRRKK